MSLWSVFFCLALTKEPFVRKIIWFFIIVGTPYILNTSGKRRKKTGISRINLCLVKSKKIDNLLFRSSLFKSIDIKILYFSR